MATADSTTARSRLNITKEVAALERLSAGELRERYEALFKESTRATNRTWLIRRICWRIQALEEGELSERARERARELATTSTLRVTAPRKPQTDSNGGERTTNVPCQFGTLPRVLPGTEIVREYKGRTFRVMVRADGGFDFEGERYRSLSAIAKKITGSHWNGFRFFNLPQEGGKP